MEKLQALMRLPRARGDSKAKLRPGQWTAIDELVNHRRKPLVVERTGSTCCSNNPGGLAADRSLLETRAE